MCPRLLVCLLLLLWMMECKLEQVLILFRHGARYPLKERDLTVDITLKEMLTPVGMRQCENLGQILRQEYIDSLKFAPSQYEEKSIEVLSTSPTRTILSATSLLYGLYPLGFGPKLPQVDEQYLLPPFKGVTDAEDKIYALPEGYLPIVVKVDEDVVFDGCTNWDLQKEQNIAKQRDLYDRMTVACQPLAEKIGRIYNIQPKDMSIEQLNSIFGGIHCNKYLGKPYPAGITEEDYANMKHIHEWFNNIKVSFDLAKAVNTGKLKRLLADFDGRISNVDQELKWTLICSHDIDLSAMFLNLNISSAQCVEELYRLGRTEALNCNASQQFAGSLIFQLHSEGGDYFMKIKHDGVYINLCERKSTSCPYEEWKDRVKGIILDDVNTVCGGQDHGSSIFM